MDPSNILPGDSSRRSSLRKRTDPPTKQTTTPPTSTTTANKKADTSPSQNPTKKGAKKQQQPIMDKPNKNTGLSPSSGGDPKPGQNTPLSIKEIFKKILEMTDTTEVKDFDLAKQAVFVDLVKKHTAKVQKKGDDEKKKKKKKAQAMANVATRSKARASTANDGGGDVGKSGSVSDIPETLKGPSSKEQPPKNDRQLQPKSLAAAKESERIVDDHQTDGKDGDGIKEGVMELAPMAKGQSGQLPTMSSGGSVLDHVPTKDRDIHINLKRDPKAQPTAIKEPAKEPGNRAKKMPPVEEVEKLFEELKRGLPIDLTTGEKTTAKVVQPQDATMETQSYKGSSSNLDIQKNEQAKMTPKSIQSVQSSSGQLPPPQTKTAEAKQGSKESKKMATSSSVEQRSVAPAQTQAAPGESEPQQEYAETDDELYARIIPLAVEIGSDGKFYNIIRKFPHIFQQQAPDLWMMSVTRGFEKVGQVILDTGVIKVNALTGPDGKTALHHAAKLGHDIYVQFLLKNGADWTMLDGDGLAPIHYAVTAGHHLVVTKFLNFCGSAVVNLTAGEQLGFKTALHLADKWEIVTMMLIDGVEIGKEDSMERTALHYAAIRGDRKAAMNLVNRGKQLLVDVKDAMGKTAEEYVDEAQKDMWEGIFEGKVLFSGMLKGYKFEYGEWY